MKVGIIGCGYIGTELAKFIDKTKGFELIGLFDIDQRKPLDLIKHLLKKPKILDLESLIKKSDLIIESASAEAVKAILSSKNLDRKGKKLLVMSSGGIIKNLNFYN